MLELSLLKELLIRLKKIFDLKSRLLLLYSAFGLPYGILLANNMRRMSKNLYNFIDSSESDFFDSEIIHSHKLTFEGYIGYLLSKQLNKKLFISLRQTDTWVLKYRKDLLRLSRDTLCHASKIFYIAPYMKRLFKFIWT